MWVEGCQGAFTKRKNIRKTMFTLLLMMINNNHNNSRLQYYPIRLKFTQPTAETTYQDVIP